MSLDCAAYGAGILGRPLTPLERLGLSLNRRLALGWWAASSAMGAAAARGREADLSLFEAVCESEEEALDAEWEHNSAAKLARYGGR